MSKIPSFGFRSKLKAPAVLKARSANTRKNDDAVGNLETAQERPSPKKSDGTVSCNSLPDDNGTDIIDNENSTSDTENGNNNISARSSSGAKGNLEQTSNNLSKLADKLGAGASHVASGIPSKMQPKPAFRRRGSSNIAKLNTGKGKERSGATQIHGQTPYSKSPRLGSKPPLGMQKNAPEEQSKIKTRLAKTSGIPSNIGRGFVRKDVGKEADCANETFSMPLKKQKGEDDDDAEEAQGRSTAAAATATTTATTVLRRPSSGSAPRSGLRPPSGNFTGIAIPKADSKMKPPSIVSTRGAVNSKGSDNTSTTNDCKGVVLRRNSGQETAMVKRSSKENLRTSGIATYRQKQPSKELQTMAEKLKSYSGKRMQRPTSVCSERDLRKAVNRTEEPGKRRSLLPTNLRSMNSSSLQDISRRDSSQDRSVGKTLLGRSGSLDKSKKLRSLNSLLPDDKKIHLRSSDRMKHGTTGSLPSQISAPSNSVTGLVKPHPRLGSKAISSTNSEFGVQESLNGEPYQSTPVRNAASQDIPSTSKHPFASALSATISGVFEDAVDTSDSDWEVPNPAGGLHETFTSNAQNRTFDAVPTNNNTFVTSGALHASPIDVAPNRDNSLCNQLQANLTFEVETRDEATSKSSLGTDDSYDVTKYSDCSAIESGKLLSSRQREARKVKDKSASPVNDKGFVSNEADQNEPDSIRGGEKTGLDAFLGSYCSDDFIINETMPTLDGSFALDLSDERVDVKSSSPVVLEENARALQAGQLRVHADGDTVKDPDGNRPASASRGLAFEGLPRSEDQQAEFVLATSLINDSYDVVTVEEASDSGDIAATRRVYEESSKSKSSAAERSNMWPTSTPGESTAYPGDEIAEVDVKPFDSGIQCVRDGREETSIANVRPSSVSGDQEGKSSAGNDSTSGDHPNKFQITLSADEIAQSEVEIAAKKEASSETDFSSLLSQTVETLLKCTDNQLDAESMLVNLPTPGDCAEAIIDGRSLQSSSSSQMKIAARRRSLVRRNTSPYATSLSGSLSTGTSFRVPRETSIAETDDGNVVMDEGTYRHCQNDVRMIKTNLLRLKRVLQELDTVSPFMKHSGQFTNSPPVTPTRPAALSRSFSDASCWLSKAKKKPAETSSASEQLCKMSNPSLNKTDEDKVKDEIVEIKEKQVSLERELEEAKHDLLAKENTIRLLQTQLENQEYLEQIELLTEEKIILFEENQELKERIDELESKDESHSPFVRSIKDEYLKLSRSSGKIKSDIVKGYYENEES